MKTLFTRSTGILVACLIVFLGSCMDSVFEPVHAAGEDIHSQHEAHKTSEKPVSDASDHENSDGEHCVKVDFSLAHNNIISIQKVISNAVQAVIPELALHPIRNLYKGLEVLYDPGIIALNSFQEHIRSVLIRV